MTTSPFSSSKLKVQPPSEPRRRQPASTTRRRPSKFVTAKLAILTALVILILGSVEFISPSAFRALAQGSETAGAAKITGDDAVGFGVRLPQSYPIDSIDTVAATPTTTGPRFQQLEPPPTPAPLPTAVPTAAPISVTTTSTATLTSTATISTSAEIKYVVIITIDGLRPDALDLTNTPTLDNLRAKGAFNPNAQTVLISETLPSHASMLSGMLPEKNGILWGIPYIGWPGINGPTLFSAAHDAGFSTALVSGKQKLNYLVLPNSVDRLFAVDTHDTEVKDQAIEFIQEGMSDLLFIHFPDNDRVGHAYGWLSPNQLMSVTFADSMIGEVVTELENDGYLPNTLLIITADHGGHGQCHGDDAPEDRTIPWLAVGPGIPAGVTLYSNINTYDTAATALYALNLPIPENWDGQPVLEIFQQPMELAVETQP